MKPTVVPMETAYMNVTKARLKARGRSGLIRAPEQSTTWFWQAHQMASEIYTKEEAGEELYVELNVIPLPSDESLPAGIVRLYDPRKDHSISAQYYGVLELAEAHKRAHSLAHERKVGFIWINDPGRLFPREYQPPSVSDDKP